MFIFLQDSNKDSYHLCYHLSSTERIGIQGRGTLGNLNIWIYVNRMDNTEEARSFPAKTPQDNQNCTRQSTRNKANCLTCNKTGIHHIRDLSQNLGSIPKIQPKLHETVNLQESKLSHLQLTWDWDP